MRAAPLEGVKVLEAATLFAECFTPSASQVADAAALLAAVAKAGVADGGVIVLPDGRMVDPAMLGRAHELTTLMREIDSRRR